MDTYGEKPQWFKEHEDADMRRFSSIDETLKEMKSNDEIWRSQIKDILEPISETYKTASTMGKWAMAAIVFVSIIVGIIVAIKSTFFPN